MKFPAAVPAPRLLFYVALVLAVLLGQAGAATHVYSHFVRSDAGHGQATLTASVGHDGGSEAERGQACDQCLAYEVLSHGAAADAGVCARLPTPASVRSPAQGPPATAAAPGFSARAPPQLS